MPIADVCQGHAVLEPVWESFLNMIPFHICDDLVRSGVSPFWFYNEETAMSKAKWLAWKKNIVILGMRLGAKVQVNKSNHKLQCMWSPLKGTPLYCSDRPRDHIRLNARRVNRQAWDHIRLNAWRVNRLEKEGCWELASLTFEVLDSHCPIARRSQKWA